MRHFRHRQFLTPVRVVIGTVGQYGFIDSAMVLQVCLAIAGEIGPGGKYRAFDRSLEKAGRPGSIVHVDGISRAVVLGFSDLDRAEAPKRRPEVIHQTTAKESPTHTVPS